MKAALLKIYFCIFSPLKLILSLDLYSLYRSLGLELLVLPSTFKPSFNLKLWNACEVVGKKGIENV